MKKKVILFTLLCVLLNSSATMRSIELPVPIPLLPSVQSPIFDALSFANLPARILSRTVTERAPIFPQFNADRSTSGNDENTTSKLFTINSGKRTTKTYENTGQFMGLRNWRNISLVLPDALSSPHRPRVDTTGFIVLLLLAYLILLSKKSDLPWEIVKSYIYNIQPNLSFEVGFFNLWPNKDLS